MNKQEHFQLGDSVYFIHFLQSEEDEKGHWEIYKGKINQINIDHDGITYTICTNEDSIVFSNFGKRHDEVYAFAAEAANVVMDAIVAEYSKNVAYLCSTYSNIVGDEANSYLRIKRALSQKLKKINL